MNTLFYVPVFNTCPGSSLFRVLGYLSTFTSWDNMSLLFPSFRLLPGINIIRLYRLEE